mmetsp:Transcript_33135/g.84643  ORF Transcript_33135/g.84643 Transcript_33135/m.84643 type:complete len:391 (-) Transcript_33135:1565-2737(-)
MPLQEELALVGLRVRRPQHRAGACDAVHAHPTLQLLGALLRQPCICPRKGQLATDLRGLHLGREQLLPEGRHLASARRAGAQSRTLALPESRQRSGLPGEAVVLADLVLARHVPDLDQVQAAAPRLRLQRLAQAAPRAWRDQDRAGRPLPEQLGEAHGGPEEGAGRVLPRCLLRLHDDRRQVVVGVDANPVADLQRRENAHVGLLQCLLHAQAQPHDDVRVRDERAIDFALHHREVAMANHLCARHFQLVAQGLEVLEERRQARRALRHVQRQEERGGLQRRGERRLRLLLHRAWLGNRRVRVRGQRALHKELVPHPCDQLLSVERLVDPVVATQLQALHDGARLILGGDHYDGQSLGRGLLPLRLQHVEAGDPRHHQVQEDEVWQGVRV